MNQTIKLDTRKCDGAYGKARIATLRRGERNNALLTVKVCANGQPYDLAGKTASLVATTAAGKLVGPCPMEVAEAGIARIMLPAALYSTVGSFSGYVEIREGDTLVDTTDRFGGKVIECADLDSEQAAEFTPLLGELQNAVAEEAKRVEAEKARSQAETERVKAEEERGKAEEKRAQDSKTRLEELAQAKINAETATCEANTARDEAKKAATDATSAAGKATDAAVLAETAQTNANTAAEEAKSAATKADTAASSANSAAESASSAAVTAGSAASTAGRAADEAESAATKADASANKADIAAGKANEATVAATNAATKANEVEAKLTGNILKGKVKDTFVHVDDAFPSSLLGIEVEGACRQDGTPSPDNPVPIEVIEHPVVKVTGRNLLDCDRGINECFVKNANGTYTLTKVSKSNRFSGSIPCRVLKGSKIYISGAHTIASTPSCVSMILVFDDGTSRTIPFISEERTTVVANVGLVSIKLYVEGTVADGTSFTFAPQVEYGTEATAYAPYVGTSQTFTLPAEHPYLAKLPDGTADEIVVDREGNVSLVARVGKAVNAKILSAGRAGELDNTNGVSIYGSIFDDVNKVILDGIPKASGAAYCDKLYSAKVGTENVTNAVYKPQSDVFVVNIAGAKDENDAKAKFDALESVVYAPIVEKHYQLGKIEMPKAQDSIVNVWTDAEVTPNTSIEYTRDVNIVVANLESAIASIS